MKKIMHPTTLSEWKKVVRMTKTKKQLENIPTRFFDFLAARVIIVLIMRFNSSPGVIRDLVNLVIELKSKEITKAAVFRFMTSTHKAYRNIIDPRYVKMVGNELIINLSRKGASK